MQLATLVKNTSQVVAVLEPAYSAALDPTANAERQVDASKRLRPMGTRAAARHRVLASRERSRSRRGPVPCRP